MKRDARNATVADIVSADALITMNVYTKSGDTGKTALFGGKKILKSDPRVEAYGTIDELTSTIGWVLASNLKKQDYELLALAQKDLYVTMAVLSGAKNISTEELSRRTKKYEDYIDKLEKKLPAQHKFTLPLGGEKTTRLHIARAVCRRAERRIVALSINKAPEEILRYVNRLSDLLFMMARMYSEKEVMVHTA